MIEENEKARALELSRLQEEQTLKEEYNRKISELTSDYKDKLKDLDMTYTEKYQDIEQKKSDIERNASLGQPSHLFQPYAFDLEENEFDIEMINDPLSYYDYDRSDIHSFGSYDMNVLNDNVV